MQGHLEEINGVYHMVVNWYDDDGKRKRKSKTKKLAVKGNKKRAEAMLLDFKQECQTQSAVKKETILFTDYMLQWLKSMKSKIRVTTYLGYSASVENVIVPYFKAKKMKLCDVRAKDIQDFYTEQLERVSSTTVKRYHANLHKAFKDNQVGNYRHKPDG